jgi:acyl carrier protein
MDLLNDVSTILQTVLNLDAGRSRLNTDTHLLGALPEFDSMAVVSVITALEERFGFYVDDDEIDAAVFETVGSLVDFVAKKLHD